MKRVVALLFGTLAIGCTVDAQDDACRALLKTTAVQYVGHAFGKGAVTLATAGGDRVEGTMVLNGESPEEPSMTLAASGTCRDGVARLRLAGLDHPQVDVRILGGRLVLIHDAELLGHEFGMWRARVMSKDDGSTRQLHGYLRSAPSNEGAVARR